jgi:TrmH family RNA methyltransferase
VRRLFRQRDARRDERIFLLEGPKALGEALRADASVEAVFYDPDAATHAAIGALLDLVRGRGIPAHRLERGVLERISDAVAPQGLVATVGAIDVPLASFPSPGLIVILDDVRDPGNVGAIVRAADASGATGVVCLPGTCDLYNPKVVRATAGSIFHLPIAVDVEIADVAAILGERGATIYATVADGGADYAVGEWAPASALVLGNEANGISDEVLGYCTGSLSIPISGDAESLNVAMAASVLLFEAQRRRRLPGGERGGTA